ncbi:Alpha-1,3-mannosyltransferase CMT1 [Smittium culicis]|uniref:Alpha-1,3-mannosyltransferase CMT1 n=1 Tax=Smittium culicis TaxID=133412 RepID=A0A1R1XK18_9FUNG|nr:Alpha-1,3-mannosyltransferase CMT1 [Smittium culicis]OMJ20499.1 Alpha-1,3-mannosyltransferase CMT1 [Smittium culicis]
MKFDQYLEGDGKYDYLRYNTPEYNLEDQNIMILEELKMKSSKGKHTFDRKRKYFFALNLFNNEEIIPYMIQEISLLIKFLGPENTFLSIYENGSHDKTKELLHDFESFLNELDVRFSIVTENSKRPEIYHRIGYLAEIRNRALKPLEKEEKKGFIYDKIIFFNDILFCLNDILELLYQSDLQRSDITSPLDVHGVGNPRQLDFRDSWVARDIGGEDLYGSLKNLVKHKETGKRYNEGLPLQVQCSWNGVSVLNAEPFYGKDPIRFRRSNAETKECAASECSLICNDYWRKGYRRIVLVPNILVGYKMETANLIDDNYQKFIDLNSTLPEKIKYVDGPEKVYCRGLEKNNTNIPDTPSVWIKYTDGDTKVY